MSCRSADLLRSGITPTESAHVIVSTMKMRGLEARAPARHLIGTRTSSALPQPTLKAFDIVTVLVCGRCQNDVGPGLFTG
jgi:hypothetical protein